MNKKILIFLGLLIFILNLNSQQVEARRRGGIISSGVGETVSGTWTYRKLVTISSSMIPATAGTLTDFPVLISWGTDTAIASHAQASGNDIKFMSYDTTTQLFHEREYYEGTSGKGVFWVNIPELTPATYTMWMYYGNSTANYQGTKSTWNSNYKGVWHLSEVAGQTINDSTINGNNGVPLGGVTLDATGIINGADRFDGIDDYIEISHTASLNITSAITLSMWFNFTSLPPTTPGKDWYNLFSKPAWGNTYGLMYSGNSTLFRFYLEPMPSLDYVWTPTVNTWYYLACTWDGSVARARIYVNGVERVSDTRSGSLNTNIYPIRISLDSGNNYPLNGILDEIRLSNIERSAGWIATSYNNQSNPSAYITIGDEETL